MKYIKFLGASGTVTGSCYLLKEDNGPNVLVDMGMFQGQQEIADLNYAPLQFDPSNVYGVILTHAHLDHCGRLPLLTKNGFKGRIFMTEATKDLTEIALLDAAHISEHEQERPQLFNEVDVHRLLEHAEIVTYDQAFKVGNWHVIFRDAGHILGSASIEFEDKNSSDGISKIVFSGDLGNSPQDILKPTQTINQANIVVMESTYGGRKHPHIDPSQVIQEEINAVEQSKGVLLIPAFSIERSQELLHRIDHLKREGKVHQQTPIYLDSPMASRVTKVYKIYKQYYNQELSEHTQHDDPFNFPGLIITKNTEESAKIHTTSGPMVIIAGSGMMTGGRILHHARKYLPRKSTHLLFVGYQGIETLGRDILSGTRTASILESEITVRASIRDLAAMSAHADEPKLLKWLSYIRDVHKVYLTHGDSVPRADLASAIKNHLGISDIVLPQMNEEYEID
ncbi:hypothetical protein A3H80_01885 [Candidatus Roizmanbacteria bacterium RIFCSPLOWO2_02_FULL_37_19]|uniref:MBL fold metallo-hydrolase n=1 Tax=Candidatus Roizmanbacteria bacterium RIFCSPHIGHO2_02_FULL_37_24 TaxID=1802037 RepID=A0A1F7GXF3_9BACT|nr:MAG: hypothetical protein A2862_02535 [Candidatus Roizmanbacteria bacterium RIFCSPHIGHO2_01_FULL_38_41]OGK23525.1 MAG: hypothetical protein A3C24_01885 [Candidatus Roizmanbacteria bacterium RIFCSPHIGHO2_02_FULL_37_24]OGK31931.1 MAG: hypothetical protein A3E10_05355 [Candidatus Roizmanbacteria bacterium RIFCSPHIGHO2_12_FULL_37_23]OGK45415.1 MAG: hypothetical protein A2956_04820 [Candidatus Roizmanbacteria bacterium RIFCSPLOWO2_01_FULL_37_57]OGK54061.1 MAG: hypothetical protein A3H80_01885 [Ca